MRVRFMRSEKARRWYLVEVEGECVGQVLCRAGRWMALAHRAPFQSLPDARTRREAVEPILADWQARREPRRYFHGDGRMTDAGQEPDKEVGR